MKGTSGQVLWYSELDKNLLRQTSLAAAAAFYGDKNDDTKYSYTWQEQ